MQSTVHLTATLLVSYLTGHNELNPVCCTGPLDESPADGTAEAEEAAAEAHNRSNDPDDIIDALEAAEAKHDEAHPDNAAGNVFDSTVSLTCLMWYFLAFVTS